MEFKNDLDTGDMLRNCKAILRIIAIEFETKRPDHEFTQYMRMLEHHIYKIGEDYGRQTAEIINLREQLWRMTAETQEQQPAA